MATKYILKIDQPEEKEILKTKSVRVKQFDVGLKSLVEDMLETMREQGGVGLAAPQLGVLRRVVVIETPPVEEDQPDGSVVELAPTQVYVMVNPEITEAGKERFVMTEGCLSLPGWYGDVPRPEWVTIKYQDQFGKEHRLKHADARGYFVGRIAQHEIDHLDGVLFTERIEDLNTLHDRRKKARPRRLGLLRRRTTEEA
ncbi:MAG: peptide deformylase [Herpetosiphon sp.]